MEEILEQIKQLSREQRLELVEQIYAMEIENSDENAAFLAELERRAQYALQNPHSGIPWSEVKARLMERHQSSKERQ